MDLPDHCLLLIMERCDIRSLATLSTVCTELSNFIRSNIFLKMTSYRSLPINKREVITDLIAVTRLIRSINATNFNLKIYRNLKDSKDMPIVSVDLNTSSMTEVLVESHFLKWLHYLDSICRQIESVRIHCSIYDCRNNDGVAMNTLTTWSKLKKLAISGYDKRLGHLINFPRNAWNLEEISFHDLFVTVDFIKDALQMSTIVKNIIFENCYIEEFRIGDLVSIATVVQERGGHFPLGLTFINVTMKRHGYGLLEVRNVRMLKFSLWF